MRTHLIAGLFLFAVIGCHSDRSEPTSAEATNGGEDPMYNTPDGTVGPNVGTAAPVAPSGEGLGPGNGSGPPDIVPGGGGNGGPGGMAGIGGAGGTIEEGK
jgi:hypothetical protein